MPARPTTSTVHCLGIMLALCTAGPSSVSAQPAPAAYQLFVQRELRGQSAIVQLDRAALAALRTRAGEVVLAQVPLGRDGVVDLELTRFEVTSDRTRFVIGSAGGQDVPLPFDPAQVVLLRGSVAGDPLSHV